MHIKKSSMDYITNCIYKPDRWLYYIVPNDEEKAAYYKGIVPEKLKPYDGEFGTYDCPGLFIIKQGDTKLTVIGIEFRKDDNRLNYPKDLEHIEIKGSFMASAFCTEEVCMDDAMFIDTVEYISKTYSTYQRNRKCKENPDVLQICTCHNNNRIFIQVEDVSEEEYFSRVEPKTEEERNLYTAAYHDYITGYYNWNYIQPMLAGFGYKGIQDYVFVHFDVKDFNALNIIYGHDVANSVLCKVTKLMEAKDWIYYSARCDNDNFAMMIKDMPNEEVLEKLQQFFDEMSWLECDKHYRISYRCGVVPMRNCLLLADRVADAAKLAQRMGTKLNETEIIFYTDKMHDELDWAKKIKAYLDTAIENDEFLVYLQPKYDIESETIKGGEALIRWMYHGRELLSPWKFIPIFEKDGSISKIDDIVLKKVCQCFVQWKEKGLPLYPISVNLSRKRMENPRLIEHLTSIVDSYGVDHSLIDFELTESATYDNQEYMISVLEELKARGFRTSMDDFGTGYSSLSLLTLLPIDTLKIDKSFVDGIGTPKETFKERAVVKHIIEMAKALNLKCLAEGAEIKQQVEKLRDFGCELIQGYYYSKPLPVTEYEEKLNK